MKRVALTALQVKHAKPGEKRTEIPAGPPKGLYLVVHPSGRKSWIFRYHFKAPTRGLTFKSGYPDMTLAAARAEAEAATASSPTRSRRRSGGPPRPSHTRGRPSFTSSS